jgi:hypothetical protein
MNSDGEAHTSHIMLLGVLYCAATKEMKADVFYNLLKRDST